jgi:hypothetical protein
MSRRAAQLSFAAAWKPSGKFAAWSLRPICFLLARVPECRRDRIENRPMAWRHETIPEEIGGR